MKNWIMRTPEPRPLGLTDRRAMVRAIVAASLVKRSFGGRVETVFTFPLHRRRLLLSAMRIPDVHRACQRAVRAVHASLRM
jgi:hypothetical protein